MRVRKRWLFAAFVVVLVTLAAAAVPALPHIVRILAIARIQATTHRPATIESLTLDLRRGLLAIRGVRLTDHDGQPLATIGELDARIRLRSLLRGHLWLRDLSIKDSTVRVVRFDHNAFNISDLVGRSGGGTALDVTVDRFTLEQGTVILEDRSLSPWRVWKSEALAMAARNVSTRRDDGEAQASSTINGAPVSVSVEHLRLYPIHLQAVVRARQVDLAVVRLYLPADAAVVLDRGRLDTTVTVALDARAGVRVDAEGQITDAMLIRRQQRDAFLIAPDVRVAVRELSVGNDGRMAVGRIDVDGASTLINTDASPPARFDLPRVSVRAEGLAWPIQGPARIEVASRVPGGGELSVRGKVNPQPASADIDVRLTRVNLAPWARYAAPWLRVTGTGEAALKIQAALQPVLTATGVGTARASNVVVVDGDRRVLAVERAEASGLDVQWPSRIAVGSVRLRRPDVAMERDARGAMLVPGVNRNANAEGPPAPSATTPSTPLTVTLGELGIEDGAMTWRDHAVKPVTALRLTGIRLTAKHASWPPAGPIPMQARAVTPERGTIEVDGRVGIQPMSADVQVRARGVSLGPYAAYLPLTMPVRGYADAAIAASVSQDSTLHAQVRGTAGLSRVVVADGNRHVLSARRIEARGVDVDWPQRVAIERLTLRQPWALVERDERGGFPLRSIVTASNGEGGAPPSAGAAPARQITLGELAIDDGGARVVDRSISPPYAEDISRVWVRARGVATTSQQPAHVDVRATVGPAGSFVARGSVGALEGPLFLDLTGELRDLAILRLNPYLRHYAGWNASQGRVSTKLVCRVSGEDLAAKSDVQLAHLQVVRAERDDGATQRIGLPLGLVVALLKNSHGNIQISLPIGGRLDDPRFDFHDAVWSAVRAVAIKTIALPVSWVGRLRFSPDSKIQDIEIDPVSFDRGTAVVAAGDTARLDRLAAFMRSLPDVRIVVTPVVSLGDIEALKSRAIASRIKTLMAERKIAEAEATRLLYIEQFPGTAPPADMPALMRALREAEEPPAAEATNLAKERAQTVRDALKKAGIQAERIAVNKDADALETLDAGRAEFGVTDQLKPRRGLAELLRALVEAFHRRTTAMKRG